MKSKGLTPERLERIKQIITEQKNKEMNYAERCTSASKAQGIDDIVKALLDLGISATSEQTGGFTMCAYVELKDNKYIYANPYGASVYDENDYLDDVEQYDDPTAPETIAQAIKNYIDNN